MKLLILISIFANFILAKPNNVSTEFFVNTINSKKPTWKAGGSFGEETAADYLKPRLGFLGIHPDPNYKVEIKSHKIGRITFPESFDARNEWPACKDVIDNIRDQGSCGSCWAFSAAEVMADRLCIQTNGELKFEFSPQDLVSCCRNCGYGCDGGYTSMAWMYWENTGIVSGGDYNSTRGCKPYEEAAFLNNITPECKLSCTNAKYEEAYANDRRYGNSHTMLPPNDVQQMMYEIMTNGPVQVSYSVYEDFGYYSEGVYQYVQGEYLGGHAVKIIGWGIENGVTPYWLVANSWGTKFGLKGYFKIRKSTNECGIESRVFAGEASLSQSKNDKPGSAVKILSSSLVLLLTGLIFFIALE